jgi:hypothetical protein
MLKQVQHDMTVRFWSFVIPNLFWDLVFGFKNLGFKASLCGRGSLFVITAESKRTRGVILRLLVQKTEILCSVILLAPISKMMRQKEATRDNFGWLLQTLTTFYIAND